MTTLKSLSEKLDHVLLHLHTLMVQNELIIEAIESKDAAKIAALTAKLKASQEALSKDIGAVANA